MNVRTSENRVIRTVAYHLNEFNQRHPWSHNDHFHPWILRRMPARRRRALDVGCGRGELLASLAPRFDSVHGTDRDQQMRRAAAERCVDQETATVGAEELAALAGPYDLITMVAVLHHLDTPPALAEVRRLLAPGGRLLVVGLATPRSRRDQVWDITSALANPLMGMIKHPRRSDGRAADPFPVRDPELSFDELRSVTGSMLPGSQLRRRLCFRYTLRWQQGH
ncbi:MAG: class I SAM-dependent methyltransferase [Propionibacteriaceae bacterium]